jgi:hypothetical protein
MRLARRPFRNELDFFYSANQSFRHERSPMLSFNGDIAQQTSVALPSVYGANRRARVSRGRSDERNVRDAGDAVGRGAPDQS